MTVTEEAALQVMSLEGAPAPGILLSPNTQWRAQPASRGGAKPRRKHSSAPGTDSLYALGVERCGQPP